jgi:CBS domain-containing protein
MDDFLSSIKVTQLLSHEPMITVDNHETIEQALKKLVQGNIYSVPVLDTKSGKPLGLLDLTDLLTFLVSLFCVRAQVSQGNKKRTVDEFSQHPLSPSDLKDIQTQFFQQNAAKIMNCSGQNAYSPKSQDITLKEAIKFLADRNLSRLPVVDASGKVVKLLSQSTVLSFLAKNLDKLGDKATATIDQAQLGTRPLISIPPEMRAIDAFVMMIEYRLSAIGFLGEEGQTSGNISVKDIKGLLLDFNAVIGPIADYVNMIRRDTVKDIVPLINVHTTDTVGKAIAKLAAVGIHRLYLFGETRVPVGIIALTDILRYLQK